MHRLTDIPSFNALRTKEGKLETPRTAAVSFGEDMMETLGVSSVLFI